MLFQLMKNTHILSMFAMLIAVGISVYIMLTYKSIILIERDLMHTKHQVNTLSSTIETLVNHFAQNITLNLESGQSEPSQAPTPTPTPMESITPAEETPSPMESTTPAQETPPPPPPSEHPEITPDTDDDIQKLNAIITGIQEKEETTVEEHPKYPPQAEELAKLKYEELRHYAKKHFEVTLSGSKTAITQKIIDLYKARKEKEEENK